MAVIQLVYGHFLNRATMLDKSPCLLDGENERIAHTLRPAGKGYWFRVTERDASILKIGSIVRVKEVRRPNGTYMLNPYDDSLFVIDAKIGMDDFIAPRDLSTFTGLQIFEPSNKEVFDYFNDCKSYYNESEGLKITHNGKVLKNSVLNGSFIKNYVVVLYSDIHFSYNKGLFDIENGVFYSGMEGEEQELLFDALIGGVRTWKKEKLEGPIGDVGEKRKSGIAPSVKIELKTDDTKEADYDNLISKIETQYDTYVETVKSNQAVKGVVVHGAPPIEVRDAIQADKNEPTELQRKFEIARAKVEAIRKANEEKETKSMNTNGIFGNIMKNMTFGKIDTDLIKYSMNGIAFKSGDGDYVVFDQTGKNFTNVANMVVDIPIIAMPAAAAQIAVGDIIKHNDKYVIVQSKTATAFGAVDPVNKELINIIPEKSIFGFDFYTKIVDVFSTFGANANAPFGNMLPFILMTQGDGEGAGSNNILMMLAMTNALGGGATNPMMQNLMMPFVLMNMGKGGDKIDIGTIMAMTMFGNAAQAAGQVLVPPTETPKPYCTAGNINDN